MLPLLEAHELRIPAYGLQILEREIRVVSLVRIAPPESLPDLQLQTVVLRAG